MPALVFELRLGKTPPPARDWLVAVVIVATGGAFLQIDPCQSRRGGAIASQDFRDCGAKHAHARVVAGDDIARLNRAALAHVLGRRITLGRERKCPKPSRRPRPANPRKAACSCASRSASRRGPNAGFPTPSFSSRLPPWSYRSWRSATAPRRLRSAARSATGSGA